MNILQEICQLVIKILNNPETLDKFLEGGAVISGDYFVWPLDGLADEYGEFYYAINPYTGEVYELYSVSAEPKSGIKVTDPELVKIIFDFITDYLCESESADELAELVVLAPPYRVLEGGRIICLT